MSLISLKKEIRQQANADRAKSLQRFFKTGKGQYGEGDVFVGLTVPESRALAKKFSDLTLADILALLKSKLHEERLIALLILVAQYEKTNIKSRQKIFNFYIKHSKLVNN